MQGLVNKARKEKCIKSPPASGERQVLGASLVVSTPRTCLPFRSQGELSLLACAELLSPPQLPRSVHSPQREW